MIIALCEAVWSHCDLEVFNIYVHSENTVQVDECQQGLNDWIADHSLPNPFCISTSGTLYCTLSFGVHSTMCAWRTIRFPGMSTAWSHSGIPTSHWRQTCHLVWSQPNLISLSWGGHSRNPVSSICGILLSAILTVDTIERHSIVMSRPQLLFKLQHQTTLFKWLNRFWEIQQTYMPSIDAHVLAHETWLSSIFPAHVEDARLLMSSELSTIQQEEYCHENISTEACLHHAEALNSLEDLCCQLWAHTFGNHFQS